MYGAGGPIQYVLRKFEVAVLFPSFRVVDTCDLKLWDTCPLAEECCHPAAKGPKAGPRCTAPYIHLGDSTVVVLRVQACWCWVLARPHDGAPWSLRASSQLVLVRLHHGIPSTEQGLVVEETCSDCLLVMSVLLLVTAPVHPSSSCRLRRAVDDEPRTHEQDDLEERQEIL